MGFLEGLIAAYGPLVVFFGAAIEGETMVVLAAFLAHHQIGDVRTVFLAAFLGSFVADQAWFWLGRRFADHPFVARQRMRPAFARAVAAVEAYPAAFIMSFRFLYGLRAVSPLAIGTTQVSPRTFVILNFIAAFVWALLITAIGWFFGRAAEAVLGQLGRFEHKLIVGLLAGLLVAALAYFAVTALRARAAASAANRTPPPSPPPPER